MDAYKAIVTKRDTRAYTDNGFEIRGKTWEVTAKVRRMKERRRQAGGLGVSPNFPSRAGGWDEPPIDSQKEEHAAPRDTEGKSSAYFFEATTGGEWTHTRR